LYHNTKTKGNKFQKRKIKAEEIYSVDKLCISRDLEREYRVDIKGVKKDD